MAKACNEIGISLLFKSTFKYSGATNTQNIRIRQGGLKMEKYVNLVKLHSFLDFNPHCVMVVNEHIQHVSMYMPSTNRDILIL